VIENDKLKTVPGFTDKTATQQYAAKLEREASMIRAGLLEPAVLYQNISLDEHLAAFETSLKSKDVSPDQVKLVVNRCKALLKVARVTRLSGISAEAVSNALAKLREKKANGKQGTSAQTSNHYLRAMKQFTRWLRLGETKYRRPSGSPWRCSMCRSIVGMTDGHLAMRKLQGCLQQRKDGKVAYRMDPADRMMLYVMALSTGLRASELASLTTEGLDLEASPPTVTVKAGYSKRRRLDILPLPTHILEQARGWLKEFQGERGQTLAR
jgi:integrase/recombinase XerD